MVIYLWYGSNYSLMLSIISRINNPTLLPINNPTIESLTQASVFSLPQLVSSLLDNVAEAQRVQVSTRQAAVNSSEPMLSQDCLNVST